MVGLVVSWNDNICHRIIVSIALGMPKESFVGQGTSVRHISTVDI